MEVGWGAWLGRVAWSGRRGPEHAQRTQPPAPPILLQNRLRVYQAAVHLATRDFAAAAALLIDAASTFTATELFSFEAVVFYAVASATPTLPRPELKVRGGEDGLARPLGLAGRRKPSRRPSDQT